MADSSPRRLLPVLFIGVFMAALDTAVIGPAIPALRAAFQVDNRAVGLVMSVFILFSLCSTALMANLSDRYGRRPVYLASVACFALGSMLIAASPRFWMLIASRAIQGIGAGGITPTASAVVGDVFPPAERGRALGLIGATYGMAFVLGPPLAGVILVALSWHWIFLANLPIAAVILYLGARALPSRPPAVSHPPLDFAGIAATFLLLTCFVLGITRLADRFAGLTLWPWFLLAAVLLLALLVRVERRAALPIIPFALFGNRRLATAYLLTVGAGFGMGAVIFLTSIAAFAYGIPAKRAGFVLLPLVVFSMLGSVGAGRLLTRLGARGLIVAGFATLGIGYGATAFTAYGLVGFLAASLPVGLGVGIVVGGALRSIAIDEAPPAVRGAAQGLINICTAIGTLLAAASISAVADFGGGGAAGFSLAYAAVATIMGVMLFVTLTLRSDGPVGRAPPAAGARVHETGPDRIRAMRDRPMQRRIVRGLLAVLLLIVGLVIWLRLAPPALLRVGANYAAKIVCSNVFLAHRDADEVLRIDVQAPGQVLLRLVRVSVDPEHGIVRAALFGFIGNGLAAARPRVGCAVVADGRLDAVTSAAPYSQPLAQPFAQPLAQPPDQPLANAAADMPAGSPAPVGADAAASIWPTGSTVVTDPALDRLLTDERLAGRGMRAIVVVHAGRIVAERYAPGFHPATPLLGWSMTKSVMAGLLGMLVKDGRITLDQSAGWPAAPGDGRSAIRIADLLSMSSGLRWNEEYGAVSDVTRMLFLEPDMVAFARSQPLAHPVGTYWSYSSGTSVILSRLFQDAVGAAAVDFVHDRLFAPLGMASATLETDERGTFMGSSYLYASARDWARYGQWLLADGVWNGREMLPRGYVAHMATPVAASGGQYGQGQVWLWGSDPDPATPTKNPDTAFGIPPDTFWMEGHDGQYVAIIPSRALVVVRMGLTPDGLGYRPQPLVAAMLTAAH